VRSHVTGTKSCCLATEAHVCVNNLPKVATWKRSGRKSNARPLSHKSITPVSVRRVKFIPEYWCPEICSRSYYLKQTSVCSAICDGHWTRTIYKYQRAFAQSFKIKDSEFTNGHPGTARIRPPHAAAAAVDRYLLPARPTSANLPAGLLLWTHAGTDRPTDRRTDGLTPYRFIDPASHTMRAVQIVWYLCPLSLHAIYCKPIRTKHAVHRMTNELAYFVF